MNSHKVLYPCAHDTLRGRLGCPHATLVGVTDIFPYKEHLSLTAQVSLSAELNAELIRFVELDPLSAALCLSGAITELSSVASLDMPGALAIQGQTEPRLDKHLDTVQGNVSMSVDPTITCVKPAGPVESTLCFGGSMYPRAVRLRELGDLIGLTLGDISAWTLNQFYYKEE